MTGTNVLQPPSAVDRIFGAVVEAQTWRNVLYLLISFPLGVACFVFTVTGISLGAGLALIVIGIPILVFTLMVVSQFGRFERMLLRNLLGASIQDPRPAPVPPGIVAALRAYLRRPETWKAVVYTLVHLPFGVISLGLVMSFLPASLILLVMPVIYTFLPIDVFNTPVTTIDQAVLCSSTGAILMLVGLHVMNGWAALWKRVGAALLQ